MHAPPLLPLPPTPVLKPIMVCICSWVQVIFREGEDVTDDSSFYIIMVGTVEVSTRKGVEGEGEVPDAKVRFGRVCACVYVCCER